MTKNNDFSYFGENENTTTVWRCCDCNSLLAERFHVPAYEGVLPFLLSGDVDDAVSYMKSNDLQEEHLLKGILYGLYEFDYYPKPWQPKKDRETLLFLLDVLKKGFGYDNQEIMVLNVAENVRKEYGNGTSRIVLEVGNILIQQSSKIKSDLIIDLWEVICKRENNSELLERIVILFIQIDLSEIKSFAKEIVCFYSFCALVFLKKADRLETFLQKVIHPNVENDQIMDAVHMLLASPNKYTPEDLRICRS